MPKGPKTKDAVDARGRILASAMTLFAERGFDGTSTKAIAEHAGVPTGLLFYYFESKEVLLEALLRGDTWYDGFRNLVPDLPEGPVLERFRVLAAGMLQWMARNRQRSLLYFQEMTSHRKCAAALRSTRQQLVQELAALLQHEMNRGSLREANAVMLSHILTSELLVAAIVDQPAQAKRYAAEIVDCVLGPILVQSPKRVRRSPVERAPVSAYENKT